jgi:signal transduction histidine kinase
MDMRFRTWPVAALGLAGLLVLVIASGLTASRKARDIYTQLAALNDHHRDVAEKLRRLRSDVNLSGIFVRDYLLDTEREHAADYRQRLGDFRAGNEATLNELAALVRGDASDEARLDSLRRTLDEYWATFEPLFDWTPIEKQTLSGVFLRRKVLPKREAVLAIAQQIEELNNKNLADQRTEVAKRYEEFRRDQNALVWRTLLLGVAVALIAVMRLRTLEGRSETQRAASEDAERLMRDLSQQLVATQEEERKKLSRELHDHVGQLLTALRMELGRLDRQRGATDAGVRLGLAECRQLVDKLVRVVRDLALGLRPSMLDDLGLQPALEWLVRDVSRRSGMDVELTVTSALDGLEDRCRTCVYRAVQEALTNCVRHSGATHVRVVVGVAREQLTVTVADDGAGFDPMAATTGLGLRGMKERVKELGGALAVHSEPARGTTLRLSMPAMTLAAGSGDVARVAG